VRRLDEVATLVSVVVTLTPMALERWTILWRALSHLDAIDLGIQSRVHGVDALDRCG
jgi:hypothetical protein